MGYPHGRDISDLKFYIYRDRNAAALDTMLMCEVILKGIGANVTVLNSNLNARKHNIPDICSIAVERLGELVFLKGFPAPIYLGDLFDEGGLLDVNILIGKHEQAQTEKAAAEAAEQAKAELKQSKRDEAKDLLKSDKPDDQSKLLKLLLELLLDEEIV